MPQQNTLTSALTGTVQTVAIQDGDVIGAGTGSIETATGTDTAADPSTGAAGNASSAGLAAAGLNSTSGAASGDIAAADTTAAAPAEQTTAAFTVKTASEFVLNGRY